MSRFKQSARVALFSMLALATSAGSVQAGFLDRLFGREVKPVVTRAQSTQVAEHLTGNGVEPDCYCQDYDHNPHPGWTRHCRHKCKATYYPAMPPYCAPCWGVYPTCWRRGQECWVCPQERYATRPDSAQPAQRNDVPPSPPPYGTPSNPPLTPGADDPLNGNESAPEPVSPRLDSPTFDPAEPQSRRIPRSQVRQVSVPPTSPSAVDRSASAGPVRKAPAESTNPAPRAAASQPAPAVPTSTKPAKNKTIEELLRDLQ